ncbi:hypothetical protein D3C77_322920 [compost metagenome]
MGGACRADASCLFCRRIHRAQRPVQQQQNQHQRYQADRHHEHQAVLQAGRQQVTNHFALQRVLLGDHQYRPVCQAHRNTDHATAEGTPVQATAVIAGLFEATRVFQVGRHPQQLSVRRVQGIRQLTARVVTRQARGITTGAETIGYHLGLDGHHRPAQCIARAVQVDRQVAEAEGEYHQHCREQTPAQAALSHWRYRPAGAGSRARARCRFDCRHRRTPACAASARPVPRWHWG